MLEKNREIYKGKRPDLSQNARRIDNSLFTNRKDTGKTKGGGATPSGQFVNFKAVAEPTISLHNQTGRRLSGGDLGGAALQDRVLAIYEARGTSLSL